MQVAAVGSVQGTPLDSPGFQDSEQVSPDIRGRPAVAVGPGVALRPVTAYRVPESDRRRAETGMWLPVAVVFKPLNGHERVDFQLFPHEGHDVIDGKCVAVQEDQDVGVVGLRAPDDIREDIQLRGMPPDRLGGGIKILSRVGLRYSVQERIDPERLGDMPVQVPQLDVDPAIVLPVNRGDVHHHRILGV